MQNINEEKIECITSCDVNIIANPRCQGMPSKRTLWLKIQFHHLGNTAVSPNF
jgi:hypothetical protein